MSGIRLPLLTALVALSAPRAGVAQDAVALSAEPVKLESEAIAIEPVDTGEAALAAEGATEVAELTAPAALPVPKTLRFMGSVGAVYDDNIYQTNTNTEADTLFLVAAGLLWTPRLTEKNEFSLGYTATAFEYLDNSDLGGDVNHDVQLDGRALFGATTFTGNFGYRHLAGADVSLAGTGALGRTSALTPSPEDRSLSPQEERDLFSFEAGFQRPLAGKTSLTGGVRYETNVYDGSLANTDDLQGYLGVGYLVGARTTLGLSGVIGRSGGDEGTVAQSYESLLMTARYDATEKLDFSGSAGLNFRQADVSNGDDTTDFVFNLSARYQWRERTGFFLNAGRNTFGSATLPGSSDNRTSVYLGVNQKIGERLTWDLAGGYDFSDYQDPTNGYSSVREEDFVIGRTSLNYQPGANWFMGVYYEYRQNDSSDEILSYESNRFGLQLALSF